MKKFSVMIIAIMSAVAMTSCSGNNEQPALSAPSSSVSAPETSVSSAESETAEPESTGEKADELYAPLLPDNDEMFPGDKIKVVDADGGTAYEFCVSDYKDEEFDAYAEKCREMGFTDIQLEQKHDDGYEIFDALTEDGSHYVVVEKVPKQGVIRVRAGIKENN